MSTNFIKERVGAVEERNEIDAILSNSELFVKIVNEKVQWILDNGADFHAKEIEKYIDGIISSLRKSNDKDLEGIFSKDEDLLFLAIVQYFVNECRKRNINYSMFDYNE